MFPHKKLLCMIKQSLVLIAILPDPRRAEELINIDCNAANKTNRVP